LNATTCGSDQHDLIILSSSHLYLFTPFLSSAHSPTVVMNSHKRLLPIEDVHVDEQPAAWMSMPKKARKGHQTKLSRRLDTLHTYHSLPSLTPPHSVSTSHSLATTDDETSSILFYDSNRSFANGKLTSRKHERMLDASAPPLSKQTPLTGVEDSHWMDEPDLDLSMFMIDPKPVAKVAKATRIRRKMVQQVRL
jgi:hypothetical protein